MDLMTRKKIIILLIVLAVAVEGIYLAKDYLYLVKDFFGPNESNLPMAETWNYEKYLEIGYSQDQIDKLIAEVERLNSEFEKSPDNFETLLKIGNIYTMLEEYQKAEDIFLQAVEIEPSYAPAHYNLGELYGSFIGEKDKALEYYQKAIELAPWRSQYYRSLADLYWSDFPEKESEIEPLMLSGAEKYPENIDFYTYLASYFRQKDNLTKAIYYLKEALRIEPDNQTLKQELVELESVYGK